MKFFALIIFIASTFVLPPQSVGHPVKREDAKGFGVNQDEFKTLAKGQDSSVDTPFIFIARDGGNFKRLQSLVPGLAAQPAIDFMKNAVVAVFAGEKNTGGYSVSLKRFDGRIKIDLTSPQKGDMVTQVITAPFKVVLVPISVNSALEIEAAPLWTKEMKRFQVTKADFQYSGGFAPKQEKFTATGNIDVLMFGDFATFVFDLMGQGKASVF